MNLCIVCRRTKIEPPREVCSPCRVGLALSHASGGDRSNEAIPHPIGSRVMYQGREGEVVDLQASSQIDTDGVPRGRRVQFADGTKLVHVDDLTAWPKGDASPRSAEATPEAECACNHNLCPKCIRRHAAAHRAIDPNTMLPRSDKATDREDEPRPGGGSRYCVPGTRSSEAPNEPALLLMEAHEILREHEVEETVGAVRALQAAFRYGASFPRRPTATDSPEEPTRDMVDAAWASTVAKRFVEDMEERGALGEEPNDEAISYHLAREIRRIATDERNRGREEGRRERAITTNLHGCTAPVRCGECDACRKAEGR